MRRRSLAYHMSTATAAAALLLGQIVPQPVLAQPAPSPIGQAGPDQQSGDPPERAGRVARVAGTVSFHTADADQWSPTAVNYPVASGDSFWTEPSATIGLEISANRIAMAGGTEFDVGTLDPNGLQATLPQGETWIDLRGLAPNEAWSVQTPRGTVVFSGPGRYDLVAGDTQNPTTVTVVDGAAQVTGPGVSLQVAAGQTATITGADTFQGSVGPAQLNAFANAMQRPVQPPPPPAPVPAVVAQMPGGDDLSVYGNWTDSSDYGEVWYPRVAAGWVPYRDGHWAYIQPWGWTWVDDAPWGFAPFHYGRWVEIGGRWGWTPGAVPVAGPPIYAPALVTFFGIGVGVGIGAALAAGTIGWCPLGPREAYHPWYHASDRYFQAVNRREVTNVTVINRNVTINNFINRGAVTVVPASAMAASRPVRQFAQHVAPATLADARPAIGTAPVRPTLATAGVTPRLARQMNLPPTPGGLVAHAAPGPAIHAPLAQGVAARPPLPNPGAVPGLGAAHPAGVVTPGAPALRSPAARESAMPPPVIHPQARPSEPQGVAPVGVVHPGVPPAGVHSVPSGPTQPGVPQVVHPTVVPPRPGEPLTAPAVGPHPPTEVHPLPQAHTPTPPVPQVQLPTPQLHTAPPPQVHAAPPQPLPQVHAPTPPQVHAAPPLPPPQVHAAPPPPQVHAVPPQPPPQVHAAPPPPQVHAAPPQPPPQVHAAPPPPQVHAAPPPHPTPHGNEKPEQH